MIHVGTVNIYQNQFYINVFDVFLIELLEYFRRHEQMTILKRYNY